MFLSIYVSVNNDRVEITSTLRVCYWEKVKFRVTAILLRHKGKLGRRDWGLVDTTSVARHMLSISAAYT